MAMSKFTLEHVAVGSGYSRSGRECLANCYVECGPFRGAASLDVNGDFFLDYTFKDAVLRAEIAIEFRAVALKQLIDRWARKDAEDRRIANGLIKVPLSSREAVRRPRDEGQK